MNVSPAPTVLWMIKRQMSNVVMIDCEARVIEGEENYILDYF